MKNRRYFNAKEAAGELGISLPTLYAYVSRGLIRSEETGDSRRVRRYYREDVERLKARREWRKDPDTATRAALHAGAPVMESAITLITDDRLYYRGRDALALSIDHRVEQVVALIWTGDLEREIATLSDPHSGILSPRCQVVFQQLEGMKPIEAFQVLLPLAASEDLGAYDLNSEAVVQTGARILRLLASISAKGRAASGGITRTLQRTWAPHQLKAKDLINATLILCADHELNASAFTARCVASTGSTPYAVVSAGLAALQGFKHGGASEQVESFLREAEPPAKIREVIAGRLKRGAAVPGFGHVIYRDVDPRARVLLQLIAKTFPQSATVALADEVIQVVHELTSLRYNLDLALAVLARVLGLPAGGAATLFAIGRTIGWIGHAIEQYQLGRIIRPRARYVGPHPEDPR